MRGQRGGGFTGMLSGGGGKVGVGCCQLWLILMVWVYPAGGATVSQEEKEARPSSGHPWLGRGSRPEVASVTWARWHHQRYRVGHKGKVDLKCVGEAAGGRYYRSTSLRLGMGRPSTTAPAPSFAPSVLPWAWESPAVAEVSAQAEGNCLSRPAAPPTPGKPAELQRRVSADGQPFQRGDKVKCLLDTDVAEGDAGRPRRVEPPGWPR